jgi:hypothetical protein
MYIQYLLNVFCMLYESNGYMIYLNLKGFSFHISSCIEGNCESGTEDPVVVI